MAFDAEGYRQAAKEAGISDDVIKRTIAEQSAGVKDVATKPTQQDVSVEMFPNLVKQVMEYAPEAIGAYLGYKALTSDTAKSVGKSIKDRMIGAPKEPARIEPTMEGPKEPTFSPPSKVGPVTNMPGTPEELQKALGPNWEATLAKSEAARKEKQMLAQERARASMGEIPTPVAQPPVPAPQPVAPSPVAQVAAQTAPVAPPTVAQIAQQAAPAVAEAAQAPAAAIPPATEESKTGRPKGSKTKTPEQRLAEKGGLPGMTKEEAGMRGHLLGMYGGKENPYAQKAYEQVKEILGYTPAYPPDGKGGSLNPEEKGKILDWRKANIEGPKVNLTHEMKKTLKGGGAAAIAALALTPAFVNASESQKRQMLGEALLPMGLTPSELESGTLTEKKLRAYQEAQKLGSPYRSVPPPR